MAESKKPQPVENYSPWSRNYIGVPLQYLCVGFMVGGSTSILYPILIVKEGVTSSMYTASIAIVTIFWSYKIIFGILSDCFPIYGQKRKPYIIMGWILCAIVLLYMANIGDKIESKTLVLVLTFANLGYVMADVAGDGFMVWLAHREVAKERGHWQTLVYISNNFGQILINLIILFGFSGPEVNCAGYERDSDIPCSYDEIIWSRNEFIDDYPEDWCHMVCSRATFSAGLTIPEFSKLLATGIVFCLPFFLLLNDEKAPPAHFKSFMSNFWRLLQRRASWQIILYIMISNITFGVSNPAKVPANYVWLGLTTTQYQIMVIMEKLIFFVGLSLVRKYALNMSWRKLLWIGSFLSVSFNVLYYAIVFNIWRNTWFYIFTDVSSQFMYTLNFMASLFCMVEVAEPGYESITYALITTASNAVTPLSAVISYQLLAFFPGLNSQSTLASDTPSVRWQFATLHFICLLINFSSLLSVPMLPRQKKEVRMLVESGETSSFWSKFALLSALVFLIYSTIVTFLTVVSHETYGCYKVLGGAGCTEDESSIPAYCLVAICFLYVYGLNFYFTFWPILQGKKEFSFSIFF